MKRKDYQKPTMQIAVLQQQAHLMAGSVESTRTGYGTAVEDTWGDEPSSSRKNGGYNWDEEEENEDER